MTIRCQINDRYANNDTGTITDIKTDNQFSMLVQAEAQEKLTVQKNEAFVVNLVVSGIYLKLLSEYFPLLTSQKIGHYNKDKSL